MGLYVFEPSDDEVAFCVLQRPHGTVLLITVDSFPNTQWQTMRFRSHHVELNGGLCTGDTDYHSHFSMKLNQLDREDQLVDFALQLAEQHFADLHPKGQLDLFELTTH